MDEHDLLATCWTSAGRVRAGSADERSPVPIAQRVRAVADAGYSGMGFGADDLVALRATIGFEALRHVLDDAGIVWIQVGSLRDWWTTGGRRAASNAVRSTLLEAAATLRATHVIVESDVVDPTTAPERMRHEWRHLAGQAAGVGAQLVLEAPSWSNLPTTEAAARFVREANHPNGGLLVDLLHAQRGGSTAESLRAAIDPERLFAVELCDGGAVPPAGMGREQEAVDARDLPGAGSFDLPEFIATMRDLGFGEPWGVEVASPGFRALPVAEALSRSAAAARAVLDAADTVGTPPGPVMPSGHAPASAVDSGLPYLPL